MNKHLIQLDGLRFLAVSGVMYGHWVVTEKLTSLNRMFAWSGVNLFFVLSGFLIAAILMRVKETSENKFHICKQFYIRRFLRIFPLYYFIILLGVLLSIPGAKEFFYYLISYTSNYKAGMNNGQLYEYSHLWSLAVEEQFYIIFPLLIIVTPRKFYLRLFFLLALLAMLSRVVLFFVLASKQQATMAAYMFTPCCFDSFAIGAILAHYYTFQEKQLILMLKKWPFFFTSVFLFVVCFYYNNRNPDHLFSFFPQRTLFSIFCFWIIGIAAMRKFTGVIKAFLENKFIIYLGKITYGIYLFHHFMPYLFNKVGFSDAWYIRLFYPVVTIMLAAMSWSVFEKPINTLKNHFQYLPTDNSKNIVLVPNDLDPA